MRRDARLQIRHSWLSALALLLCIGVLSACSTSQPGTGNVNNPGMPGITKTDTTPTPTPAPTNTVSQPGCAGQSKLSALRMLDQSNGWALNTDTVLKTADGGLHWSCVGPAQTSLGKMTHGEFLNDQTAWVSTIKASVGVVILHTTDGGQHWQSTTVNGTSSVQDGAPQLDFINSQLGWFEVAPEGGAAGSEAIDIYHTSDGGTSWSKIASTLDASSGLPNGGIKSGLSFKDALNGWVTGEDATPAAAWLYATHDGGKTWKQQQLPNLPASQGSTTNDNAYVTTPPVFFGQKGLLPVEVAGQVAGTTNGFLLYTTSDGGLSWKTTYQTNHATLAEFSISQNANALYIADLQHAWAANPMDGALYGTSDGGQSWHKLAPGIGQSLAFMSFPSAEDGWVVDNNGLSKTTDGGQTFQKVNYTYP